MQRRPAFTLIELLVVIAINRHPDCPARNGRAKSPRSGRPHPVRQQPQAAGPGGPQLPRRQQEIPTLAFYQLPFAAAPKYRGVTLFVYLLPQLEQNGLYSGWDFNDPLNNTAGGSAARTAALLSVLTCPADLLAPNPTSDSNGRWYALTSYGGNGGTRSYDPQVATNDGIFHVIGAGLSRPPPNGAAIRMADVTDGLSNTILFGRAQPLRPEPGQLCRQPDCEQRRDQFDEQHRVLGVIGGPARRWRRPAQRLRAAQLSVPASYANRAGLNPPVSNGNSYLFYNDRRVCAFGSQHGGGANFALADGSVRFIADALPLATLQMLVRAQRRRRRGRFLNSYRRKGNGHRWAWGARGTSRGRPCAGSVQRSVDFADGIPYIAADRRRGRGAVHRDGGLQPADSRPRHPAGRVPMALGLALVPRRMGGCW